MKRKISLLLDENGSGLVVTMMVFMVLSVLGSAIGLVTIGSVRLSTHTHDSNSAYYIAEAGANMAYEEFKQKVLSDYSDSTSSTEFFNKISSSTVDAPSINGRIYTEDLFQKVDGHQPSATIELVNPNENGDSRTYTIISTGEIDRKTRKVEKKVTVNWVDKKTTVTSPIDLSAALSFKDNVLSNSNKLTIDGKVISVESVKIQGNNTIPKEIAYESYLGGKVAWDQQVNTIYNWLNPILNNKIGEKSVHTNNNQGFNYNDKKTGKIEIVTNNGDIMLNQGVNIEGNVITYNGKIQMKNNTEIIGNIISIGQWTEIMFDGPVKIKGDIISSGKIHFKKGGIVEGNIISTGGEIMFEGSENLEIKGSVITLGKWSNIKFGNKHTTIAGNVISNGGEMQFTNPITIYGATINSSGRLMSMGKDSHYNGPVLVRDFQVNNSTTITHTDNYKNYFPFNASGGNSGGTGGSGELDEGSIGEIIDSKPATEK